MQKLFTLSVLGLFLGATTLVGCRASAEVDDVDHDRDGKTTIKKTSVGPDGDRKVTKETKSY
jgi:hypothetical protein